LTFAGEAIDVHPPRATAWGKSFQGLWRFRVLGRRIWAALRSEISWNRIGMSDAPRLDLPTVVRGVEPGWANIHTGHKSRGYLFLAAYGLVLLPAIAMLGTSLGAILLGIAFGIHAVSVVTALVPVFETYRDRLIFSAVCGLALALVVYVPAGALLSRVATPLNINQAMHPFSAGDVVWYRPTSSVGPGQYALHDSAGTNQAVPGGGRYPARFVAAAGLRINRVLATEGQTLKWDQGRLVLDEAGAIHNSGSSNSLPADQKLTVPPGHVLIDPSNFIPGATAGGVVTQGEVHGEGVPINVQLAADIWQSLAIVPVDRLRGVVFWRSWPISHAGFIN
jgi:hypothetical protein